MFDRIWAVNDLLGRDDWWEPPSRVPRTWRVLVTGAGGDVGRGVSLLASRFGVTLGLVDRDDLALQDVSEDLLAAGAGVHTFLGDVADADFLAEVFEGFHPTHVVHCAVVKAARLLEQHPELALATNAAPMVTVANLAGLHGCEAVVLPSSVEAFDASTVFGLSKLMGEALVHRASAQHPGVRFTSVRFGAIVLSHGSVGETFYRQALEGQDLRVADARMQRAMYSLTEVSAACLQACVGFPGVASGHVLQCDLSPSIRFADLAQVLVATTRSPSRVHIAVRDLVAGEFLETPHTSPTQSLVPSPVDRMRLVDAPWDDVIAAFDAAFTAMTQRHHAQVLETFHQLRDRLAR